MLKELNAIAERIVAEEATPPGNRRVVPDRVSGRCDARTQTVQIGAGQRHMRLGRGPEIRVDPQMQLPVGEPEPAAAAPRQAVRLGKLGQAQQVAIEKPCRRLLTGRHRDLDVIEAERHDG